MKLATWNVNSIRARLERVLEWFDRAQPDVVCLQETKVTDDLFPREPFDLLWATESLAARAVASSIDRDARNGKQPSDHAPVLVEIAD